MCQFQDDFSSNWSLPRLLPGKNKKHSTTGQKCQKLNTKLKLDFIYYYKNIYVTKYRILKSAQNNWILCDGCSMATKQLISNICHPHIWKCILLELYYVWFQLCHFFLNHCKLLSKRRKLWPKLEIMFKWFAQQYQKKLVALLPHQ